MDKMMVFGIEQIAQTLGLEGRFTEDYGIEHIYDAINDLKTAQKPAVTAKSRQSLSVEAGYEPLAEVFQAALDQSQRGKGKERHASDRPILRQPICEIGRMVGVGYNVGQAMKKGQESMRLPADRAQAELLGAINYLAAAYLLIEESKVKAETAKPLPSMPSQSHEDARRTKYDCGHYIRIEDNCDVHGKGFRCYGCDTFTAMNPSTGA